MKRLLIIFFSLVLLASCQKFSDVNTSEKTVVTYCVQPSVIFEVKSQGEASAINVLWYGVFHKKNNGDYVDYVYMNDMSAFVEVSDISDIKVPITLIKDQEYRLVFVAQHRIESANRSNIYTYNVGTDGILYRNVDAPIASGEQLDVFVACDEVGPIVGNENRNITLERPVAQINIATSSTELPETLDVTFSGMPASYDIFNNTYSQETAQLALTGQTRADGILSVDGKDYNRLSTTYVLGGNTIDCAIHYGTTTQTVNSVATAPNHKTNIVGNI